MENAATEVDVVSEVDAPEEGQTVAEKIEEVRQSAVEMVESYLRNLRSLHQGIVDESAKEGSTATLAQLETSRNVLADIDIFEDPIRLAGFLGNEGRKVQRLSVNSKAVKDFRSACRRAKVAGLDVATTIEMVETIQNRIHRDAFRSLLVRTIERFSSVADVKTHRFLVAFIFTTIRVCIRTKTMPVICGVLTGSKDQ